jgi:hypothetical protein
MPKRYRMFGVAYSAKCHCDTCLASRCTIQLFPEKETVLSKRIRLFFTGHITSATKRGL